MGSAWKKASLICRVAGTPALGSSKPSSTAGTPTGPPCSPPTTVTAGNVTATSSRRAPRVSRETIWNWLSARAFQSYAIDTDSMAASNPLTPNPTSPKPVTVSCEAAPPSSQRTSEARPGNAVWPEPGRTVTVHSGLEDRPTMRSTGTLSTARWPVSWTDSELSPAGPGERSTSTPTSMPVSASRSGMRVQDAAGSVSANW